jgi:catechol 2,3-dioxygenase-like lactoylglutathione lyase family enzyme
MISSLDHLTVVVRDLDAAARDYATLFGRTPNWSGSDAGAEHVWFQLSNMALDLIAPTGPGYIGDFLRTRLSDVGEGLWALAFATPDVHNMHRILRRRDVKAAAPQRIRARNAQSGVEREWLTTILATAATHGVTIAVVEQQSGSVAWSPAAFSAAQDAAVSGLDHVVVTTPQPERALAFYGARLDLEMALDRTNPDWGARLMFFRCGELIVEVAHNLKTGVMEGPDKLWGVSWRTEDIEATRARLASAGVDVSEVRPGRKAGTRVFTVRDHNANVPTIVIGNTVSR